MSYHSSNKPKFFVRYPGGASGQFIALILTSLQTPIDLLDPWSAHPQIGQINAGHNFHLQFENDLFGYYTQLRHGTEMSDTMEEITKWLRQTFTFGETDRDFYVAHTHAHNYTPLLNAWPESKVISISCESDDMDQLAYNFVGKSLYYHKPFQLGIVTANIQQIQINYQRLKWISVPHLNVERAKNLGVRLHTYSDKHARKVICPVVFRKTENTDRVFNITFKDILNKKIITYLDDIIDFLGITPYPGSRIHAENMIHQYVDAQLPVPWDLSIDTYD